jgi:hypothetical protein
MAPWTPPAVTRQLADEAERDAATVHLAKALRGQLDFWNRELRQIDDRLELVWFDENVDIVGVVPCRYHLIRRNDPPAPVSVIPITGPDGEFIEPNSALFDRLRAADLWNDEARRDRQKRHEELIRRKRRQQERETEERQEEILERYLAATRTQVSLNTDAPWTQNQSPASRRDQAARRQDKAAA